MLLLGASSNPRTSPTEGHRVFTNIVITLIFLACEFGLLRLCYRNNTPLARRQYSVAVFGAFAIICLVSYWLSPIRGADFVGDVLMPNLWLGWINLTLLALYMIALVIRGIKKYGLTPASL